MPWHQITAFTTLLRKQISQFSFIFYQFEIQNTLFLLIQFCQLSTRSQILYESFHYLKTLICALLSLMQAFKTQLFH